MKAFRWLVFLILVVIAAIIGVLTGAWAFVQFVGDRR